MSNIVTDLSVNKKWYIRQSDDNEFSISFVDSNSDPFDVSPYVFTLKLARKEEKSDPDLTLTEGSGITNNGATGVVDFTITDTQSAELFNTYYYEIQATFPDGSIHVLFQGEAIVNDLEYKGNQASDVTATVSLSGSSIAATISLPGSTISSTDDVSEGGTNLYFTEPRVRATLLAGLSLLTSSVISASDSVISAFGKLQAQISDRLSISLNLSDLDNSTTARTNLDVYSTSEIDALVGGNGFIDLTPIAAPAYLEGRVFYDNVNKAASYYNDEADVTVNVGQENLIRVRNSTGATITNGQAVYINGSQGSNLPTVALAQADVLETSRCIGIATHDIENNTNGYITTLGEVRDLDTSAFTAGDALYLSEITAGALTVTKPTTGFALVVGYCVISNASNGEIKVISGTTAERANTWIDSETFIASSGTEIQNEAKSDVSGQTGTAGFTGLDWDIQGAGGSGTKRYIDFKDDGVRKFEVKLDGEFNSAYWNFNSVYMGGSNSGNAALIAGPASLNNPTVVPRRGDSNTGLGGDGLGTGALIGDGVTCFTFDSAGDCKSQNDLEVGDFLGVNIAPSSSQIAYFAQIDSSPHVSDNTWANATFPSQTRGRNGDQTTLSTPNYHVFESYGTDTTPAYSYIGSYSPSNGTSEMVLGTWDGTGAVEAIKIDSSQNTFFSGVPYVPSFTVAGVPSASTAAGIIYVSNETGGAVLAFSDGTNWRRVTDRSIIA